MRASESGVASFSSCFDVSTAVDQEFENLRKGGRAAGGAKTFDSFGCAPLRPRLPVASSPLLLLLSSSSFAPKSKLMFSPSCAGSNDFRSLFAPAEAAVHDLVSSRG